MSMMRKTIIDYHLQVETTENDKYFDRNDSIAAFWNNSRTDGLVSAGLGYLQLPQADNRGFCNDWNFASFENEVVSQDNSCVRTLSISPDQANSSFQEQCIYQQSVARYVTDLWVARFVVYFRILFSLHLVCNQVS